MYKSLIFLILFSGVSCSVLKPISSEDSSSIQPQTNLSSPSVTPQPSPTNPVCLLDFQQRELHSSLQSEQQTIRQTVGADEMGDYLSLMGIEKLCIPTELGAPFINVDWQPGTSPALTGHMISVGFENLYSGAGWSDGHILYANYDFKAGTEYDTFATLKDRDMLSQGTMENPVEVNGKNGFVRTMPGSMCMGACPVYKVAVFPFEEYYLSVVYKVGVIQPEDDWDTTLHALQAGDYAAEQQSWAAIMDQLTSSLHFIPHKTP
jgi:hypothetical protein